METEQVAYLQSEIARLNKIITVLLNQNEALTAKISHLENQISIGNVSRSYVQMEKGSASFISPHVEMEKGTDNAVYPYDKNEKGSVSFSSPYVQMEKGADSVMSPYDKSEKGAASLSGHITQSDIGENATVNVLPSTIPISKTNIAQLRQTIGPQYFFRVKHKGVDAMLQILLQVYNKDGCTYVELRRLANRSHGGMSKLVASLKKRGLVERIGKSKLRLTSHALHYLQHTHFEI